MAKRPQKKEVADGMIPVQLPIEFRSDDAPAIFANQMWVQVDEHEVHMSFFDIKPPLLVGTDEEKREQLKQIKSVTARCVARVVITTGRLEAFVNAMQSTLAKHKNFIKDSNGKPK